MTVRARIGVFAFVAASVATTGGPAFAAPHDTTLVSQASGVFGRKGNDNSYGRSISSDGRFVAFQSTATNLSPADSDSRVDVYVRDADLKLTTLVSRASGPNGPKAAIASGNASSRDPAIADGAQVVAFVSSATNLSPSDSSRDPDVYVRDLQSATTTLVSRASGPLGAKGNRSSVRPSISRDGRYVAFMSRADNLDPVIQSQTPRVYVRDLLLNTTTLVARVSGAGGAPADGSSVHPVISDDGRHVAFSSYATNLNAAAPPFLATYVRDLQSETTTLVSRATGAKGAVANQAAVAADLSPDGGRVVFSSSATNLSPDDLDADVTDVYVRDVAANTTTLVSRAAAKGNADSFGAGISKDGRMVAFSSEATNLSSDDHDPLSDVHVRDLQAGTTTLVSRAAGVAGAKSNSASSAPALSADGRSIAFTSAATNLSPEDPDERSDVFVRRLAAPAGG